MCWIDQLSWQAISVSGLREITEMGHVFSTILWELPWARMLRIVRRTRKIGVSTINCVLIVILLPLSRYTNAAHDGHPAFCMRLLRSAAFSTR